MSLPAPIAARLQRFCEERRTGNVQLDIKDGVILAYKVLESERLAGLHGVDAG